VPADLDLKPYRDEHDFDLLKRMLEAVEQATTPKGIDRARVRKALDRHAPELRQHLDRMARAKQ
jgi:hypothetical protein